MKRPIIFPKKESVSTAGRKLTANGTTLVPNPKAICTKMRGSKKKEKIPIMLAVMEADAQDGILGKILIILTKKDGL